MNKCGSSVNMQKDPHPNIMTVFIQEIIYHTEKWWKSAHIQKDCCDSIITQTLSYQQKCHVTVSI